MSDPCFSPWSWVLLAAGIGGNLGRGTASERPEDEDDENTRRQLEWVTAGRLLGNWEAWIATKEAAH